MLLLETLECRALFSAQNFFDVHSLFPAHGHQDALGESTASHANTSIKFSGYTWNVRSGDGGPRANHWSNDSSSVFVDCWGRLHLKVSQINSTWYSSEVSLGNSLGYGTYRFDVASRVDLTDPNLTAAGFLYASDTNEYDVEFSKWGNPSSPTNADFATQPSTAPNAIDNWNQTLHSPCISTYTIIWTPGKVEITASQGPKVLQDWTYTGPNTFAPGSEAMHFNHWLNTGGSGAPSNGMSEDFIIQDFKFTPQSS